MRFEDVLLCTVHVIGDGGWSKLSYKHSYNANAGVAIILEHKHQQTFIYWCAQQRLFHLLYCPAYIGKLQYHST